LEAKEN